MCFIFGVCLINPQSTQEPASELLNDTEIEKDVKKHPIKVQQMH